MATRLGNTGDASPYEAWKGNFKPSSTKQAPQSVLNRANKDDALNKSERLTSEFSIQYNGHHYQYDGYRYDRLSDALFYAQLMRSRTSPEDPRPPLAEKDWVESPSESDRKDMATLSITFSKGVYLFAGFRYDHLADAISYAQLTRNKSGAARQRREAMNKSTLDDRL